MTPASEQLHDDESIVRKVVRHSRDLMGLAWPVMLSRAGILVMAFTDIAMLGRYSTDSVAVSNLGIAIFVPVLVIAIGLVSGLVPVVSQAYGAGHWQECGRAWRRSVSWAVFVSIFAMMLVWHGESWLLLFGQTPELSREGGAVAVALTPGILAQVIFAACAFYMESIRRPFAALLAMVAANLMNVGLNWIMIFGNLGWPEMGAIGAAWASTAARFLAMGIMLWVVLYQRDPHAAGVRGPYETIWGPGGWRGGVMMRKLGTSAGLSNGFETIGFAAMTMFAGTLGVAALGAYSISHNLVSTFFMIGLGLAVATGVRVGQATGAGDAREAAFAGWTGLLVAFVVMGTLGVLVLIFRDQIALAYTDDADLAMRASAVFVFSAFVFLPDSLQVVIGQALRALGDAWAAVAGYIFSFVILMVPLGWWLTKHSGWDERGLVLSVIISCFVATALLAWRFRVLTRIHR